MTKTKLKKLYKECFDDNEEFVNYFFSHYYDSNSVVYEQADGTIVSAIHLINKRATIRGGEFDFPFATAVSTLPAYRKQGLASKNMHKALEFLSAKKVGFLALYPVSRAFYLPFGYVSINRVGSITLSYSPLQVDVYTVTSQSLLNIYLRSVRDSQNFLMRNQNDFARLLGDWKASGNTTKIYSDNKRICYCTYSDTVEEAVGDIQLLNAEPDLNGKIVTINGNDTENTMCRIVDIITVLNGIKYDNEGEIVFEVTDKFFPTNNGTYLLTVQGGRGVAQKVVGEQCLCFKNIKQITIEQLTEWIFGINEEFSELLKPINFFCLDKY